MRRAVIAQPAEHEVWVTRKKPLVVYVKRALQVLNANTKENTNTVVVFRGVGAALRTAVHAAQDTMQQSKVPLTIKSCETGTASVLCDKVDFESGVIDCEERGLPSITITLTAK